MLSLWARKAVSSLLLFHAILLVESHAPLHPCTTQVIVRFPPSVSGSSSHPSSSWVGPPSGWLYGNWKIVNSSQPGYLSDYNLQLDMYPILPTNTSIPVSPHINLVSLQTVNSSAITTIYAVVTPDPIAPFVFDYAATGYLVANTTYDVIAWGYDYAGTAYFVTYDGPTTGTGSPSDLTFYSRSEKGLSKLTLFELLRVILQFADSELTKLVSAVAEVPIDGRRTQSLPVNCNNACVDNAAFEGLGL